VPTQKVNHLVINNDVAPTAAELAGVAPPSFVDGKSFVPLLRNEKPGVGEWRTGFLVEHVTPTYQALRTNGHIYVEWSGGEQELYDLREDPYQLHSLHETVDPGLIAGLSARLEALKNCAAEECRAAERA
jgi:N-acetylglucosamine-6-sulfatase